MSSENFDQICFVIMPFGKKKVGTKTVDFNMIYDQIFEPAIRAAETPEGAPLIPRRTDKDAFSGSIIQDMYELLIYSRMALADISGLNPNAFYELGARHATQEAGTTILRQTGHDIPFDISTIKVFEYGAANAKSRKDAQKSIADILTATLERNKLDSPIRQALGYAAYRDGQNVAAQPADGGASAAVGPITPPALNLDVLMCDAEDAMMHKDWVVARAILQSVLRLDPTHLKARFTLGAALNGLGKILEAAQEFAVLTRMHPEFGPGWRQKGIAESKLIRIFNSDRDRMAAAPEAERSFERAIALQPKDFKAMAAYGGLLRRIGKEDRALEMYERASDVSNGNPYPLLNAIKLQARARGTGKVDADPKMLANARDIRERQAENDPPTDVPWCFFDLAVMDLFEGNAKAMKKRLQQGFAHVDQDWMVKTLLDDIDQTLVQSGVKMAGLGAFEDQVKVEMAARLARS